LQNKRKIIREPAFAGNDSKSNSVRQKYPKITFEKFAKPPYVVVTR
jgi:hypothetical protein